MNRFAPLLASFVGIGIPLLAAAQSDWVPAPFWDAGSAAPKAEEMFKSFKNVVLTTQLDIKCPFSGAPDSPFGQGQLTTNAYFWSFSKYQIQYNVYSTKKGTAGAPVSEFIVSFGKGPIVRHGAEVGPNARYDPKSKLFNVATDQQLVELWPSRFPKYLYSPFVGGNATLSRYIKAVLRGVGGY